MRTRPKKYRTGVTAERILDHAVELTGQVGLYGWSIRDLVAAVGTSPSVVYRRVGGRDELCRRVVERILTRGAGVDASRGRDIEWREWFKRRLFPLRGLLAQYPGVAKWMFLHGPIFEETTAEFDEAMRVLRGAGFGEDAATAYALVFNTAMATISMSDERAAHEDDGPRDHAHIMSRLRGVASGSPAVQSMIEFVAPFTEGDEAAERARDDYYRLIITTVLDGLEQRLLGRGTGAG